ncbi:MAG: hypothetical protein COB36_12550 [Alphaproteobacteria bacterium]|nr:MAG: hypothetical protein COB36_12550 [Alphaproteobacteria bacterium]
MSMYFWYAVLGTALDFAGLCLLWRAWKNRGGVKAVWLGWVLLCAALIVWAMAGGKDRGVALGLILVSLQAPAIIGFFAWRDKGNAPRAKQKKTKQAVTQEKTKWTVYMSRIGTALLVGPVAGIIAFVVGLGVHEVLAMVNVQEANALAVTFFGFPIVWASISVFMLISQRTRFKIIILSTLVFLSILVLILGN